MAWEQIIGLNKEKQLLQKALITQRLASAYCFLGIEGVGKDAMALELAKTANCYEPIISNFNENSNSDKTADNDYFANQTISACDSCKSCRMANSFSHPNIQYIFAMPTGDKITDEQDEAIKDEIKEKIKDKYHKISIPNAKQINISLIRKVKKNAALSSANKGRSFVIISNGDLMNTEAANAFLKTLEEPQANTTIIITSSQKEKLLQTILSRCQQIYFNPLHSNEIAEYLVSQHSKTEAESKLIAAFAQGSILKAVESFDDDMNLLRSEAVDVLRIAFKRKLYRIELLDFLDKLLSKKDKKHYSLFLNLLLIWFRDVYTIGVLQNMDLIINVDLSERMSKFYNGFPNADFHKAIFHIENAINKIDYNIDPKLVFISLFVELRRIFLGIDN